VRAACPFLLAIGLGCSGEDPDSSLAPAPDARSDALVVADRDGIGDAGADGVADASTADVAEPDDASESGPANDAAQDSAEPDAWTCDPASPPLPNEGLLEAGGLGGCPAGMARVDTFCIDRFEAALDLLLPSGGSTSWSPYLNPGATAVRAVSIEGAVPQAYVSQQQAAAACANSEKRLCTDDEWLRACSGVSGNTYPYGSSRLDGVCNDSRSVHPAIELFGTTDPWIYSELDDACLDQLPDTLDPAGSNPDCRTPEGIYDLMGNLHEWTADPSGTFRGGFFVDTRMNGEGCLYKTTAHATSYWDYSTGFRCCAEL
jgi:formylglycine-generating enzyme